MPICHHDCQSSCLSLLSKWLNNHYCPQMVLNGMILNLGCGYVTIKTPQPPRIITNQPSCISVILPIRHYASQPSCPSTIKTIGHQTNQPSFISAIFLICHHTYWSSCPSEYQDFKTTVLFATFKLFSLFFFACSNSSKSEIKFFCKWGRGTPWPIYLKIQGVPQKMTPCFGGL